MLDEEAAIEFYLKKKVQKELDLNSIKEELKLKHRFDEKQIAYITREITSKELDNLKSGNRILDFFNHVGFSYFMIVITVLIFGFSIFILSWNYHVSGGISIAPLAFISGSILFFGKHRIRIKKYNQKRAREL